jgi:hypothetical protein
MTLLTQTTDVERYDELRALVQRLATQMEELADQQALLVERLGERRELLSPPRVEGPQISTPH